MSDAGIGRQWGYGYGFKEEGGLGVLAIRAGLRTVARKLESGADVNVAFIGGSVTDGSGASDGDRTSYRAWTCGNFARAYPKTRFSFANAAIGGTNSTYGAFRLHAHALSAKPIDLLFVEFAVNDAGNRDESVRAMEGIVRRARTANPDMDIAFIYTASEEGAARFLAEGVPQRNIAHHEIVAEHYGIPSASLAREVYERIAAGRLQWRQISEDNVHPNDEGHALYAEWLWSFLREALSPTAATRERERSLPLPLDEAHYGYGELVHPREAQLPIARRGEAAWSRRSDWTFEGTCYWKLPSDILYADGPGASLRLAFEGTAVGLVLLAGEDLGDVEASLDGGAYEAVALFDDTCLRFYRPKIVLLADGLAAGRPHTLDLRVRASQDARSRGTVLRILHFLVNGTEAESE